MKHCYNQRDSTRRRDRETGLKSLDYEVKRIRKVSIDEIPLTLLNVWLNCDTTKTPWCDCKDAPKTEAPLKPIKREDNIMPYLPKKNKKTK